MTEIKVCGIKEEDDLLRLIDLNVTWAGFVFYKDSIRNVDYSHKSLFEIARNKIGIVCLFVNPRNEFISKIVQEVKPDLIQLHGSETYERVKEIKSMGIKIIKAIKIKDQSDIENYKKYDNADIILFDTPGMEKSIEFPKDLISKLPKGDRYALAGSISIDNVENLTKLGVNFFDLSSSLESKLGHKDHLKVKSFMNKIKNI